MKDINLDLGERKLAWKVLLEAHMRYEPTPVFTCEQMDELYRLLFPVSRPCGHKKNL